MQYRVASAPKTEFLAKCGRSVLVPVVTFLPVGASDNIAGKNSPSRVRFRPPVRLTFRCRVRPPGLASSYSRPVLGAVGNVKDLSGNRKSEPSGNPRNLRP